MSLGIVPGCGFFVHLTTGRSFITPPFQVDQRISMNDEDHRRALSLLSEMIDMTQRIVVASSEPYLELLDLTRGLDERLTGLKEILPPPKDSDRHLAGMGERGVQISVSGMAVLERLQELHLCVDKCIQVLMRHKLHVEKELISVRQSQKALQGYGMRVRKSARSEMHSRGTNLIDFEAS